MNNKWKELLNNERALIICLLLEPMNPHDRLYVVWLVLWFGRSHSFLKNAEKFAKDLDLSKNWMNDYAPSIKYIHNFVFDLLYVRCCFVFGRKIQLLFCGFWSLVIESSSALWQVREFWNFQRQGRKQSYTLNIVFFLKMLWFFWTLPVLLQRWCSTCLVCVHTLTPRENREGPESGIF